MGLTDEQIEKMPGWAAQWYREALTVAHAGTPLFNATDWRMLCTEVVKQIERAEKAEAAYQSILTHLLEEREQVYEAEEDDIQAGAQCLENPGVR